MAFLHRFFVYFDPALFFCPALFKIGYFIWVYKGSPLLLGAFQNNELIIQKGCLRLFNDTFTAFCLQYKMHYGNFKRLKRRNALKSTDLAVLKTMSQKSRRRMSQSDVISLIFDDKLENYDKMYRYV